MTGAVLAPDIQQRPLLSHRQILAIFAGLMAGMFLAALDQTIVATSVRTIADDLNGLSLQAVLVLALVLVVLIPELPLRQVSGLKPSGAPLATRHPPRLLNPPLRQLPVPQAPVRTAQAWPAQHLQRLCR